MQPNTPPPSTARHRASPSLNAFRFVSSHTPTRPKSQQHRPWRFQTSSSHLQPLLCTDALPVPSGLSAADAVHYVHTDKHQHQRERLPPVAKGTLGLVRQCALHSTSRGYGGRPALCPPMVDATTFAANATLLKHVRRPKTQHSNATSRNKSLAVEVGASGRGKCFKLAPHRTSRLPVTLSSSPGSTNGSPRVTIAPSSA